MSAANPLSDKPDMPRPGNADFEAICDAVMATDRGRWFLFEYARRNRHTDTAIVVAAIDRLATAVGAEAEARAAAAAAATPPAGPDRERLRSELADMASAIAQARSEMAAIKSDPAPTADGADDGEPAELLDLLRGTERAASDILAAAAQIQEMAWTLREQGMDTQCCDRLDAHAAAVYAACSLDRINRQRARKVIHVQRYLEARILAMTALWGAAGSPARPAPQAQPAQSDDRVRRDAGAVTARDPPAPQAVPPLAVPPQADPPLAVPPQAVPPQAVPPRADPDSVIADLRALAASMVAHLGEDATPAAKPVPPAPAVPLAPAETVLPAPAPEAPAATAAPAGAAGEPPRPATDIAEELFADVMALSEDERTALFS